MIHLWLVDFQEILEGVPRQTLAYTFSFELPQHEMHAIDLGRMANLKLVDKQGKELVELKLQVLA